MVSGLGTTAGAHRDEVRQWPKCQASNLQPYSKYVCRRYSTGGKRSTRAELRKSIVITMRACPKVRYDICVVSIRPVKTFHPQCAFTGILQNDLIAGAAATVK